LSLVSILTVVATFVGVTFDLFVVVVQWLLGLLFVAAMVVDWRRGRPGVVNQETPGAGSGSRRAGAAFVAVAVVLAAVTLIHPPRMDYSQDAYDHIGYVRHIEAENSLSPGGVLASPVGVDISERPADPRKGTFHAVTALTVRLAGADPVGALRMLTVFLFPLAFLNFTLFCATFLPRRWLAVPCAAIFLLFQGGIGFKFPNTAAYGQNLSLLFYWMLVPLSFEYLESSNRKKLVGVLLMFAGGAFIHAGVVLHFFILLATLVIFQRPLDLPGRSVLKLCLWGVLVAGIAAGWKLLISHGEGNPIHLHPQGLLYLGKNQFVLSPVVVLGRDGLVFWGGLLAAPLFVFAAKRNEHARRLLVFAVIPLVICFTPFLTPLLFKVATYMTFRSVLNVPVFALVVVAFWGMMAWARRGGTIKKVFSAAILAAWSWFFLSPSIGAFFAEAAKELEGPKNESFSNEHYGELLDFMDKIPGGTVVLSDPVTSYWLSAATDLRVVAVLGQHGAPNDAYAMDRLKNCRDVLSPYSLRSHAVEACDRYGVAYVVLNGRLRTNPNDFLVNWDRDLFDMTRKKLDPVEERFRVVFEANDIVVYRYYPGPVKNNLWSPEFPAVSFDAGDVSRCRVKAPGNLFELRYVGLSPQRILPGETIQLTMGYDKPDVSAYSLSPIVHVRFDHESIVSASPGLPGEKYVRRYRDRAEGNTGRFRYDHRPFDGLYTPDVWPIGRTFYEFVSIKLPPTLRPGMYNVEFKIVTDVLLENYSIRDFLFNRDHYSGVSCLTLEVADYAIR
jgi:hypothetical protein